MEEEAPAAKRAKLEEGSTFSRPHDANGSEAAEGLEQQQQRAEAANGAPPADGAPATQLPGTGQTTGQQVADGQQPSSDGAAGNAGQPAADGAAAAAAPLADTYANREARHAQREAEGELAAHHVVNDGSPESGILLAGLRAVFSKCLPNMPREYIARLLFERRHRSVVIVRHADKQPPADGSATAGGSVVPQVIGGITYRPFHDRRFAEIAFCAVAQSLQVSGYGTRLMNWTKHYARERDGCEFFLTYADNNAVGYFSKQGFTKQVSMDKERWFGYIKDYDGGTLMECYIHPTLPFTAFPGMIRAQREALAEKVRQHTRGHVVHPGLGHWKAGPGGPLPIERIPGAKESGWTPAAAAVAVAPFRLALGGALLEPTPENLQAFMVSLMRRLKAEGGIAPWLAPVKEEEAPGYHAVIKDPIDLGTIEERLAGRAFYITLDQFVADVARCFNNSKVFNSAENWYHKAAHRHLTQFHQWLDTSVIYDDP